MFGFKKRDVDMVNGVVQTPDDFESPEWQRLERAMKLNGLRTHDPEQEYLWKNYEQAMEERAKRGFFGWLFGK